MKILIVTSNYPRWPGDSTTPFVHNFARELVNQGMRVRVIAPHFKGAKRKDKMDGVEIRRVRDWFPEAGQTVCYQGGALGNLQKSWVNKLKLPILVICEVFFTLLQTLSWKPDWINSHWLIPQGFACALVSKATGTKHVATIHGSDVMALDSKLLRKFKAFTLQCADTVTVNSSVTRTKTQEISPKNVHKLLLLPTGILPVKPFKVEDVSKLRTSLLGENAGDKKLLLFVGRLNEEKGVSELLEATKALISEGVDLALVLVGVGHEENIFKQQAVRLGINKSVNFVGWVESKDIYKYYAAADVFVGPSKRSSSGGVEAQGLTFAEAMLAGCKVVGTNSGGIPDAVIDGKTGWLAEPGDALDLSKKIKLALEHEDRHWIKQAETFSRNNFLVTATVSKFLQYIEGRR